jgi:hypothetical protein
MPKTFIGGRIREDHGVRTFLPARLLAKVGPAITRLARRFDYIILPCGTDSQIRRNATSMESSARHQRFLFVSVD